MRHKDALLCQPDFISEKLVTIMPWLEPPFAAPFAPSGLGNPFNQCTPGEVTNLLKARFRPDPTGG
jgi:hypothetical protein